MDSERRVFVIDDDPSVLRAMDRLLRSSGLRVETYDSPDAFLTRERYEGGTACVVLDLRLPGLSGLQLQQVLVHRGRALPIVFMSGAGDVASTAAAMRNGAVDFLVKPVDATQLLDAVSRALARDEEGLTLRRQQEEALERLARLTPREREVCDGVARGLANKVIAAELGTSEKTVKTHRGRAMRKLEVDSVAALVRLLAVLDKSSAA